MRTAMLKWTKKNREPVRQEAARQPETSAPATPPPAAPADTGQDTAPAEAVPQAPPDKPMPSAPETGQISSSTKNLAKLLLNQGKLSREQIQRAIAKQRATGAFIGEILIEEGFLDEKSLISFLAKHCRIPHISLLDYLIDKEIISLIPREICLQYRLLPIDKLGRNLTVAMVNPLDSEAMTKVRECCPDLRIKPILCAYKHFESVTQKAFSESKGGGMAELSATSFGLSVSAAEKEEAPVKAAPPEAESTGLEDMAPANAAEAVEEADVAPAEEEAETGLEDLAESGAGHAEISAESHAAAENEVDSESVFESVFHEEGHSGIEEAAAESENGSGASGLVREMAMVMMDSMRDTYAMLARRVDLFQGLDPESVARIFSQGFTREAEAGDVIFEKGQAGNELYVVLGGKVAIRDGSRELAVLDRGGMFGEMALVSNEPRSATAVSLSETSLLVLSMDIIKNVMPKEVSLQLMTNIIITLSARLRLANEALRNG
jgi:hypothetical protein